MNETYVNVCGNVSTEPVTGISQAGDAFTFFRLAVTVRRQNKDGLWEDAYTNWFDVKTWRSLASNCARSIKKGEAVMVRGRLKTTSYERGDGTTWYGLEIDASAVGHDLSRGTTEFTKGVRGRGPEAERDPVVAAAHQSMDDEAREQAEREQAEREHAERDFDVVPDGELVPVP
ncbi:single-stranded DNA-binding protein [Kribbia dieselivorans]|uniref:single-stranded DNA-binding protein n=1 Tax=Kribbia dieselivorans TaxID=331526 RepID=UPI0008392B68|nr:single-stranded DNA-binding protein [Kribbia dieselivorans]